MNGTLKGYRFTFYCLKRAIIHPHQPISYYYCNSCRLRFSSELKTCPKCNNKVEDSPEEMKESSVPWWGAVLLILIGITSWIIGASLEIQGLDEAARALVYIPLGSLFGMSLQRGK
jgi:hypothetical protein